MSDEKSEFACTFLLSAIFTIISAVAQLGGDIISEPGEGWIEKGSGELKWRYQKARQSRSD